MQEKTAKPKRSKKRIAIVSLIVILIIINFIVSALIFIDIRVIKSPDITIELDVLEINSNEAIIKTTLNITNPNNFDILTKNMEIITKTDTGDKILFMKIDSGEISSNENKTYSSTDYITFNNEIPEKLTTQINGIVGLRFLGFLQKTLPLKINVVTSFEEVIKNIAMPVINIKGDFGEINDDGIDFTTEIEIVNSNTFDMKISDLIITIKTEEDLLVGNFQLDGDSISAKSSTVLYGQGNILIKALDAKTLFINLSTSADVMIAGINESIEFSTLAEINIPQISDIISSSTPTEAFIDADMKYTRNGFLNWGFTSYMTLELINPNKISLIAKDIVFSIMRVDNGEKTLISDCTVNESIVGPENNTYIPAEIFMPLRSLFRGQRLILPELPDGLLVVVRANVTIPGLEQTIWIGISGYQDLHLFR